jgi:hypothetical protein
LKYAPRGHLRPIARYITMGTVEAVEAVDSVAIVYYYTL